MSKVDVIVIGGGHNGLTTATMLAKKGKSVVLLEKRNILGGIAAGEEFHPGYSTSGLLHDTSAVRSNVIKELGLEGHGLVVKNTRPTVSILADDGRSIELNGDTATAAQNIAKISEKDGKAYTDYRAFLDKISKVINDLFDNPPPGIDVENLTMSSLVMLAKKGLALKGLGKKTMLELLKVTPMCLNDFLSEKFETEFLKAGIAGPAIYGTYAGPWSAYSTVNLLIWECAARNTIIGGPQALVEALEKAAKQAGVTIRTEAEVEKILLDDNDDEKVKGVRLNGGDVIEASTIAASCTPKITFLELFDPFEID